MDRQDSNPPKQHPEQPSEWVGTIHLKKAAPEKKEAEEEEAETASDRKEMTRYERRSVRVQWLICGITAVYAFFAGLQWATMKKQLEMAARPWITADVAIAEPLTFSSNGETHVSIKVSMKNIGHSVAVGVEAEASMILLAHKDGELEDLDEPRRVRNEVCERMRRSAKRGPHGEGFVLFPEQQIVTGRGEGFGKEAVGGKVFTVPEVHGKVLQAALVGCVAYQFTFSSESHVTGFAYWVRSAKGYRDLLPVDEPLPAESFFLQPNGLAGGYID